MELALSLQKKKKKNTSYSLHQIYNYYRRMRRNSHLESKTVIFTRACTYLYATRSDGITPSGATRANAVNPSMAVR